MALVTSTQETDAHKECLQTIYNYIIYYMYIDNYIDIHQKTDFIIIISPPWYDPGCCWGVKPQ